MSEANLQRLGDNSIVDDLYRHSELVAPDGAPDPALYITNDGKTHGLQLPVETSLACNSNYAVGELFIYHNTGQSKFYLAYKDEDGSTKLALLGTDVTLT